MEEPKTMTNGHFDMHEMRIGLGMRAAVDYGRNED
jgi:hypothetical protein